MDQSAIEAINKLAVLYQRANKTLHLRHLSHDCRLLIKKAEKICDINLLEDPEYFVAVDNYKRAIHRATGDEIGEFDKADVDALAHHSKVLRRSAS